MNLSVLLTSESALKIQAVKSFFKETLDKDVDVKGINCSECKLPEQPIVNTLNNGFYCAKERMNFGRTKENFDDYDYVVSIESIVDISFSNIEDKCCILIYHKGILAHGESFGINFDIKYYEHLENNYKLIEYNNKIYGYECTIGEIIHNDNSETDSKNWMKTICNIDRADQIKSGIKKAFNKLEKYRNIKDELHGAYDAYPDYPTKGVLFYDIFPLFKDAKLCRLMVKYIANHYRYDDITYIVGLESRGFCLGVAVAYKLKVGFIPVRKAGKLPGDVLKTSYQKEYGSDSCEIQSNLSKDDKVLIIDDLIATGGSMKAAVDLINQVGCKIVDCCVLKNVPILKEQCNKTMGRDYSVLIQ